MKALDRKLLRDLARLRGQVVTIAIVVACGIAALIASVTTYRSLEASRDAFYALTRFGDLFVHLDRAPRAVLARLGEIPGVSRVDGRVIDDFRLVQEEGSTEPLLGRFVSLEGAPGSRLGEVFVHEGRGVAPGSAREVVMSELFAQARGLHAGDSIVAVIDGRKVTLDIVGLGVSPEYVFAMHPHSGLPDLTHFGVLWMDGSALAHAMGLSGAFNEAVVELSADANPEEVIAAIDRVLEPYGGLGAVDRERQPSHRFLGMKIAQFRSMARFVPTLFLGVAAFLLNLLLSRIVGTQREQIATMKALGYGTAALVRHYLLFAMVICALGAAVGVGLGAVLGDAMVRVFTRYFNLPALAFHLDPGAAAVGIAVSLAAGALGAFSAVRRTVALQPAEAMQPAPPEVFRRTLVERLRLDRVIGVAGRMVLRDLERRPIRLLLSSLAVALATAILLIGGTLIDSMDHVFETQFTRIQREDLAASFERPESDRILHELAHVPGIDAVEAQRMVAVRLRAGARKRDMAIVGVPANAALRPLLDTRGNSLQLPASGLTLSRPAGPLLGVKVGDEVEIEVLEPGRRVLRITVGGFVDDLAGIVAYMDLAELERLLGERPTVTGALLAIDRSALADVTKRLQRMPSIASLSRPDLDKKQFEEQQSDALRSFQVILVFLAAAIAVGVVFNNARIALSMRSRDLATLRILGFTRGEVALVLLGEQAVQLVLGVAIGLPLGRAMGAGILASIDPELFRIPVFLGMGWRALAALVVLLAGLGSALVVRREADDMDLVAVLKARD